MSLYLSLYVLPSAAIWWTINGHQVLPDWLNLRCACLWLAVEFSAVYKSLPCGNTLCLTFRPHHTVKVYQTNYIFCTVNIFIFIPVWFEKYLSEKIGPPRFRKFRNKCRTHWSDWCGSIPEDNREGTGSIYGVSKNKFVVRVSLRGCLNKMGNFRAFLGTTLVFLIFELCLVCCDLTDGNTEHLKREHSLMKPYQGKMAQLAR